MRSTKARSGAQADGGASRSWSTDSQDTYVVFASLKGEHGIGSPSTNAVPLQKSKFTSAIWSSEPSQHFQRSSFGIPR